jgi:hypothetical protein
MTMGPAFDAIQLPAKGNGDFLRSRRYSEELVKPLSYRGMESGGPSCRQIGTLIISLWLGHCQRAVLPTERRIKRDAAARGLFPEAEAIGQILSIGKPCIAAMELRQRRSGQSVKRLRALLTAVVIQARLRTPATNPLRSAMAAIRIRIEPTFDKVSRLAQRKTAVERRDQSFALVEDGAVPTALDRAVILSQLEPNSPSITQLVASLRTRVFHDPTL